MSSRGGEMSMHMDGAFQHEMAPEHEFDLALEILMLQQHGEIWRGFKDADPQVAAFAGRFTDHMIMNPHRPTDLAVIGLSGDGKSSSVEGMLGDVFDPFVVERLQNAGREPVPAIFTTAGGIIEDINRGRAKWEDWGKYPPDVFVRGMGYNRDAIGRLHTAQAYASRGKLVAVADMIAGDPAYGLVRAMPDPFVLFMLTNPDVQGIAADIRAGYWAADMREGVERATAHGIALDVDTTDTDDLNMERYSQGNPEAIALTWRIQKADMIRRLGGMRPYMADDMHGVEGGDIADDSLQLALQPAYYTHIARDVCYLSEGRYVISRNVRCPTEVHHHHKLVEHFKPDVGSILRARRVDRLIP